MRVIAVAAQKGGFGKTSTAAAIAQGAAKRGKSVLLIDLDSQGSLTHVIGADGNRAGGYDLLMGANPMDLIQAIPDQPDIIPASLRLAGVDAELANRPGRDFLLRKALEPIKERYSLVVVDTPPALGTLLVNALTAATEAIIPLQVDTFAVQTIYQIADTINQVQQYCNSDLKIAGAILTRYSMRTILARDLRRAIVAKCKEMGIPVFNTTIRDGVAIREAQTLQHNLFTYAPKSNPAKDYAALINELEV